MPPRRNPQTARRAGRPRRSTANLPPHTAPPATPQVPPPGPATNATTVIDDPNVARQVETALKSFMDNLTTLFAANPNMAAQVQGNVNSQNTPLNPLAPSAEQSDTQNPLPQTTQVPNYVPPFVPPTNPINPPVIPTPGHIGIRPQVPLNNQAPLQAPPLAPQHVPFTDYEYGPFQGETPIMRFMRGFSQLRPPTFNGSSGADAADSWLYRVEECLDTLEIPDRYRVQIATNQLSDQANRWWRALKNIYSNAIPWVQFKSLFLQEFVSDSHKAEKLSQLEKLYQGAMTVEEYRIKFEELSLYKDSFNVFPQEKMDKFRTGLIHHCRMALSTQTFTTYRELVEAALRYDLEHRETEKF